MVYNNLIIKIKSLVFQFENNKQYFLLITYLSEDCHHILYSMIANSISHDLVGIYIAAGERLIQLYLRSVLAAQRPRTHQPDWCTMLTEQIPIASNIGFLTDYCSEENAMAASDAYRSSISTSL
ncbi:hypothetical protein ACUTRI_08445 [Serratia sp. TSA_130.2]|uniref:hypothetical protein n=1 Tax=Serratia TaxID=613 RepID=UPI0019D1212C|nr:hypothetical protein [Serratia ureilytica]EMB2737082.1 hypothetical protein [Serratia marcescens]MBN5210095.1 hypothetical protein [Serratia ureilytica]HBH6912445.1 hypothetical protein [Serratia marcescens]HEI9710381.1 hypothetical protein [Serratia marcescens]